MSRAGPTFTGFEEKEGGMSPPVSKSPGSMRTEGEGLRVNFAREGAEREKGAKRWEVGIEWEWERERILVETEERREERKEERDLGGMGFG